MERAYSPAARRDHRVLSTGTALQVARFGSDARNLVFRVNGRVGERLVYRGEESGFDFKAGRVYAFDADGGLLRLASEAYRIRLAYLAGG
jgi:hypothetical protein